LKADPGKAVSGGSAFSAVPAAGVAVFCSHAALRRAPAARIPNRKLNLLINRTPSFSCGARIPLIDRRSLRAAVYKRSRAIPTPSHRVRSAEDFRTSPGRLDRTAPFKDFGKERERYATAPCSAASIGDSERGGP